MNYASAMYTRSACVIYIEMIMNDRFHILYGYIIKNIDASFIL